MARKITLEDIKHSFTYEQYKKLNLELAAQGKTTGAVQTDVFINYTKLAAQRLKRLEKQVVIQSTAKEAIQSIGQKVYWITLTETWCGDASQNLPYLNQLAAINENIEFRLLLRDDDLDLMDSYLTNGGRSIPKVIFLKEENGQLIELGSWGPRPEPVQTRMRAEKQNPTMTKEELALFVQKWYNNDKGLTLQKEIEALVSNWRISEMV